MGKEMGRGVTMGCSKKGVQVKKNKVKKTKQNVSHKLIGGPSGSAV